MATVKTQAEYNKIFHDWIVLLTGLNGANVRPQKFSYGFELLDTQGKPISQNGLVAMFFASFDGSNNAIEYQNINKARSLRTMTVSVTFLGESADIYANQAITLCMTRASVDYLRQYDIAIDGTPTEIPVDRRYNIKWFYKKQLNFTFNLVIDYTMPTVESADDIETVPTAVKIIEN